MELEIKDLKEKKLKINKFVKQQIGDFNED
jgi:hypothetical protein